MWVQIRCGLLLLRFEIVRRHCSSLVSRIKVGPLEISPNQAYITVCGEGVQVWHAVAIFNIMWAWKGQYWMASLSSASRSEFVDNGFEVRFIGEDDR